MTSMIELMRGAVESNLTALDPDDDLLPVLITHGETGMIVTGMAVEIEDDEGRDTLANLLTATLVVDRADAAVFVVTAWMTSTERLPEVRPEEHPQRREIIMGAHATRDGDAMHTAPIHRHPRTAPTLGEWTVTDLVPGQSGGRVHAAMRLGIELAATLPEDLRAEIAEVDRGEAIKMFANLLEIRRDLNDRRN